MKQVQDYIAEKKMIETEDRIIAGVSGGADSVCLFFELLEYAGKMKFTFEVVHVEHGVRGDESLKDAAFVENLCRTYGISFHLCRVDVPKMAALRGVSVEEAGREARYDAFERIRLESGGNKIAVAHNMDDQAETVLMNLVRGSGVRGLGGIRPVRDRIIRPLLCVGRREIEESLKSRGISWRTDVTNEELFYTRNRVRRQILPLLAETVNVRTVQNIAAAADRLQRVEAYLKSTADRLAADIITEEAGQIKVRRSAFLMQEYLMQEYLIQRSLDRLGARKDVGEVHIHAVCRLAGQQNGKVVNLPQGILAGNRNEYLVLERKQDRAQTDRDDRYDAVSVPVPGKFCWGKYRITTTLEPAMHQIIEEKKYTKWFDYDTIKKTLQIRTRAAGDYLTVNAQGGQKTLKKYLIEEKVLREERDKLPLLADGAHILWVVGHRISEAYKVGIHTRNILKVQIEGSGLEESACPDKEKRNGRKSTCSAAGRGSGQKDQGNWRSDQ